MPNKMSEIIKTNKTALLLISVPREMDNSNSHTAGRTEIITINLENSLTVSTKDITMSTFPMKNVYICLSKTCTGIIHRSIKKLL